MNQKRNAEKMFAREGISFKEYYTYLIFQVQKSFRIVGKYSSFKDQVKSELDSGLAQDIHLERQEDLKVRTHAFSQKDLMRQSMPIMKTKVNSLKFDDLTQLKTRESLVRGKSINVQSRKREISQSKDKVSIWRKFSQSFNFSSKKEYQDYETITNLRFLRLNNLTFELAYYENRGVGRINNVIDAFSFQKEGEINPEVFIKKLDIYEKNYFELLFEKNEERHKNQFSILLRKSLKHSEEYQLGVFYCENKICDLCERKSSPFDFTYPVEVDVQKDTPIFNPSGMDEHFWMSSVINMQAKNIFALPCHFFGKDFKDKYISHLNSRLFFIPKFGISGG
jgi:hypothetical protein